MNEKYFQLAIAKVVLDLLSVKSMCSIGYWLLEQGHESEGVFDLIALEDARAEEAMRRFLSVVRELDVVLPGKEEAVLFLCRDVACKILEGEVSAIEGANEIWDVSQVVFPSVFPDLDPFIYAASEWTGRPDEHSLFTSSIEDAARELIGSSRRVS